MVLTSGCHVAICRRYHTHRAQMHIDPGTWVQPVNGVIFILSSPLPPSTLFAFCHSPISSPPLIPSPFLSPPLVPHRFFSSLSSVLHSHSLLLPSIRPHGSNSLSGLSHSLQASRQSLQRLEQKTNSFKQHYIGLA